MQKLPTNIQKRHCTCVRWDDESMNMVSEAAFLKRTSRSALIREIVLEKIQNKEMNAEQKQNT